jgi:hypothetical protein
LYGKPADFGATKIAVLDSRAHISIFVELEATLELRIDLAPSVRLLQVPRSRNNQILDGWKIMNMLFHFFM